MTRTVVIGGGVGGLVAARRRALEGDGVVVLEAGARLGGRVAPAVVGGVEVDGGAESFATRGAAVVRLLDALGLGGEVVAPAGSAWVALADRIVPLPVGGVLGIPSSPLADDVRRVLDTRGALRAYVDRLSPVLREHGTLGALVRARMGERVLERLVDPVVRNVYGADPESVPVEAIAPGLGAALARAGSLSGAVLLLRAAAPAGSAALGIDGGVHRLVAALVEALTRAGVDLRTGTAALGVRPAGAAFEVVTAAGTLHADRVVVAVDGAPAVGLLRGLVPDLADLPLPEPSISRTVLVRVDDTRLDGAPRGSGVLRAAGCRDVAATALTHLTAKWPWIAERAGVGRHLLRLAYRGRAEVPESVVQRDLAALTGVRELRVLDRSDVVWADSTPALAPETLRLRRAVAATDLPSGIVVTGTWTAGTGLAAVVAAAERAARPEVL